MTTILVTRPEPDARETAARLVALDMTPIVCPLLRAHTLTPGLPDPKGFAALALTSASALRALAAQDALTRYHHLKVFAVGERTAQSARDFGFADVVTAGGTLADLVDLLAHTGIEGPIFYPAAHDQAGDLAKSLAPFGKMVLTARVYEMVAATEFPDEVVAALKADAIDAALFYSRRTAQTFVACAEKVDLRRGVKTRLGMLCISESVAEPLLLARFVRVGLADFPSEEAMMSLCLSFAREQNTP